MKKLSDFINEDAKEVVVAEADDQNNDNSGNNGNDQQQQQDTKNNPVKKDAGTFKTWNGVKMTMRGWLKTMSGQDQVKDTFFDNGFIIPTTLQGITANTQSKVQALEKNLDAECTCVVTEFKDDYSFNIFGNGFGYVSSGWNKQSGGGMQSVIKNLQDNSKQQPKQNNNNNNQQQNNGQM